MRQWPSCSLDSPIVNNRHKAFPQAKDDRLSIRAKGIDKS